MDLSAIFSLGNLGLNLFSNISSVSAYRAAENSYTQQRAINARIGALNAQVAQRTGSESMYAIIAQTKKALGSQIVEFSNRGIELDGSPMFVMGETATMGQAKAQQVVFDSKVNEINYQISAENAMSSASSLGNAAKYSALSSMMNTARSVYDGYTLMKSMFKSSALNAASTSTSTSSNSTLNAIIRSRFKI